MLSLQTEILRRCLRVAGEVCKETSQARFRHVRTDYVDFARRLHDFPRALMASHRIRESLSLESEATSEAEEEEEEKRLSIFHSYQHSAAPAQRSTGQRASEGKRSSKRTGYGAWQEEEEDADSVQEADQMDSLVSKQQKGLSLECLDKHLLPFMAHLRIQTQHAYPSVYLYVCINITIRTASLSESVCMYSGCMQMAGVVCMSERLLLLSRAHWHSCG